MCVRCAILRSRPRMVQTVASQWRNYGSSLLMNASLINGNWVESKSTFDVYNPSTGDVIQSVADMGVQETEAAIDAAYNRFHSKEWQVLTAKERSGLLKVNNQQQIDFIG